MKMKIVVILIFFSLLIFVTYIKSEDTGINYTVLGNKELFSNNIRTINFSDMVYRYLDENNKLGFYSKEFLIKDGRIIDLINQIDDNEKIDDITIKQILNKTDILLLSIGNDEIRYKISDDVDNNEMFKYLDEIVNDNIILINKIKEISDCKIIFLGYYNETNNKSNDIYYKYINKKLKNNINNQLIYIDLYDILNKNDDYLIKSNKTYITKEGNDAIYYKIKRKIDNLYLH